MLTVVVIVELCLGAFKAVRHWRWDPRWSSAPCVVRAWLLVAATRTWACGMRCKGCSADSGGVAPAGCRRPGVFIRAEACDLAVVRYDTGVSCVNLVGLGGGECSLVGLVVR